MHRRLALPILAGLALPMVAGLTGCGLVEETSEAHVVVAMPAVATTHWADEVVDELADSWPDDHRRPFLQLIAPMAMRSGAEHCIPPSVTVAQGILESGWGRSENALQLNNLFGIKAYGVEEGDFADTWEYEGGRKVRRSERFRRFGSWREAVRQHDVRLAHHPAYESARAARTSGPEFVEALAPVYATDPAYAERVLGLVELYGLDALDEPAMARAVEQQRCG